MQNDFHCKIDSDEHFTFLVRVQINTERKCTGGQTSGSVAVLVQPQCGGSCHHVSQPNQPTLERVCNTFCGLWYWFFESLKVCC